MLVTNSTLHHRSLYQFKKPGQLTEEEKEKNSFSDEDDITEINTISFKKTYIVTSEDAILLSYHVKEKISEDITQSLQNTSERMNSIIASILND